MTATRIEITASDGVAPAYVFGAPSAPAALLFIDGLGMRPAMHEIAERLASAGYHVLMPDLFYRLGAYEAPDPRVLFSNAEVRAAWWGRLASANINAANLTRDLLAWLSHFGDAKVRVTGYCMGGRLSLLAAATHPDRIVAAAAYHPGGVVTDAADSPHLLFGDIRAKVYVGGAKEDSSFTDAQRQTTEESLTAAGVDHLVELYDARHGWVPSDTPVHDDAATARHWETLLALFARTR